MNTMARDHEEIDYYRSHRFAQLTLTGGDWIYLNPTHVIAVLPGSEYTEIRVAAPAGAWRPIVYRVREMAEEVLRRFSR